MTKKQKHRRWLERYYARLGERYDRSWLERMSRKWKDRAQCNRARSKPKGQR